MIADAELTQMMEDMSKNLHSVLLDSSTQQDKILNKITRIVRNATREQLLSHDPHTLVVCVLKLILHYEKLLYINGLCEWKRRRKFKTAWYCYYTLLKNYLPEKSREIVKAVIDCVYENRLWVFETFCFEIMCKLLYAPGVNGTLIIQTIWNKLQLPDINVEDARNIIRVLYELLDVYEWPATQETVMTIEKMLELFHASIMDTQSTTTLKFSVSLTNLKKSLEICLRNIIKNLSNYQLLVIVEQMCSWIVAAGISDEIVLEFSNTLEYAAYMHHTGLYEQTLIPTIFPLLIQMISSTSRLTNLLGNRVLQYLLDRRKNRAIFNTPRIFLEHIQYDIRIGPCHRKDRIFIKTHRELLHDGLLKSMVNHSDSRINLETTYCTICLIAIEISCGFTAAALVCLAMNLQEITLQQQSTYFEIACHIHAIIISIMSLVCWIHKAKVFYSYVNGIMMERAKWAPHLNPPIQSKYNFAVHHIIWNKPELFFVDWEARYGLWKCFRLTNSHDNVHGTNSS